MPRSRAGTGRATAAASSKRHRTVPARAGLVLVLAAALGACDGGPREALDRYVSRLSGALDVPAPPGREPDTPLPPRVAALQLPVPRDSIDALDFLALRGCALQVTVGKRNSSLGRFAPPSQRLLLELEFLRHAPACVEALRERGETALATTLADTLAAKRAQLPARLYNATLGSEEFRALWRAPVNLGDYPASTNSAPPAALAAIDALAARWLGGDYRVDNSELELLLADVASGDGGELLAALGLQRAALRRADGILERRRARGPLCHDGLVPREVSIVKTVVRKFFVGDVQPWSAAVDRRRQALLPSLRSLEQRLANVLPASYRAWRDERDRRLAAATAPREHVRAVQGLLEGCPGGPGLAPG